MAEEDPRDPLKQGWDSFQEGQAMGKPVGYVAGKGLHLMALLFVWSLTFLPATIWIFIRTGFGSRVLFSALLLPGIAMGWLFINVLPLFSADYSRLQPTSGAVQWTLLIAIVIAVIVQIRYSALLMERGSLHSMDMGFSILLFQPRVREWYTKSIERVKFDFFHVFLEPFAVYFAGLIITDITDNTIWRNYFMIAAAGMFLASATLEVSRLLKVQGYADQFIQQEREREAQREATAPFRPREIDVPEVEVVYREDYPVLHPTMEDIYADTKQEPPR